MFKKLYKVYKVKVGVHPMDCNFSPLHKKLGFLVVSKLAGESLS